MNQREKEAAATLVFGTILLVLGILCWLQKTMAPIPWVAGPISLGYALFMAISHRAVRKRGCIYDERDAAIAGMAWRAALNGAVFAYGIYVLAIVLVYGRAGDPMGKVSIPLVTLPAGLILLTWAAAVTWAVATLRHSLVGGRADADREPSS